MVPLTVLVLDEALLVPELLDVVDEELDEEHAARASAATASPAVVTCSLRRRCISGTPYRVYRFLAATSSPVVHPETVCRRPRNTRGNERCIGGG
jgi:hypothetical protein